MGTIHQIYATHCTYGTSAIERRTSGDAQDRVLGYGARASSFSRSDLRKHFRTIERFLYYYLPKETPPERKQQFTPQAAPHRMFFCPSLSGLQAVGYVSYRQTDRAGRVGSYFAHVLTSELAPAERPWDVIDCLKLWNAPGWMIEDSDALTYDLPPAPNLSALRHGHPEPVDEKVLWSFLNTPPQGTFGAPDPAVIPERWRKMSVDERRKRFRQSLMGYLEIADQPRESLLLLAEPAVAVLFFYGIARLLPPALRTSLSFSTLETNPDRLVTSLAALTFDDEQAGGDLPPERYRRGFVVNTWEYKASELRAPDAKYADFVLAGLVGVPQQDAPALARSIDDRLSRFQGRELQRVADLEDSIQANTACEQVVRLTPNVDHTASNNKPAQKAFNRSGQTKLRQADALGKLLEHPWRIAAGSAALVLAAIILSVAAGAALSLFQGTGEIAVAAPAPTGSGEGQAKTDAEPAERESEPAGHATSQPSPAAKPSEEPPVKARPELPPPESNPPARASEPSPRTPPQFPIAEEPQESVMVSREAAGPWRLGHLGNEAADLTLYMHGCELLNCSYKYPDGRQGRFHDARAEWLGETGGRKGLEVRATRETGERAKIASINVGDDGSIQLKTSSREIPGFFDAQQFLRFCVLEIGDKTSGLPQRYIALQKPRQVPDGFKLNFDGTSMRSEATLQLEPGDAPPGETKFCLGPGRLKGTEDFDFGGDALTQTPSDKLVLKDFFEKKGISILAGTGPASTCIRVSKSGEASLLLAVENKFPQIPDTKVQHAVETAFRNMESLAADVYRIVEVPDRKDEGKKVPVRVLMIRGSQK